MKKRKLRKYQKLLFKRKVLIIGIFTFASLGIILFFLFLLSPPYWLSRVHPLLAITLTGGVGIIPLSISGYLQILLNGVMNTLSYYDPDVDE